ncbi:MAG: PEP-CTERM sorting domain-containing protein [Deltaproteobacteria bacterium]|nr:PEP-CTERM sorting domain-containing protein [Deltaproteobacteria bacterium]
MPRSSIAQSPEVDAVERSVLSRLTVRENEYGAGPLQQVLGLIAIHSELGALPIQPSNQSGLSEKTVWAGPASPGFRPPVDTAWGVFTPFVVPAGSPDFLAGTDTLTTTITGTENFVEGVRLQGDLSVVSSVTTPEPSSVLLLLVGLACVWAFRRGIIPVG